MAITVTLPTIPERAQDQDEAIVVIVARRTDPENPDGSPAPDLNGALSAPSAAATAGILALVTENGFDPDQTYVTVASLTDAEQGGAITLSDLVAITPPAEPDPEPQPEG